MYKVKIPHSFYFVYIYIYHCKSSFLVGKDIIFLISANKITHQIDVCSDDSACAATECRSPLKTICCAQDLQWGSFFVFLFFFPAKTMLLAVVSISLHLCCTSCWWAVCAAATRSYKRLFPWCLEGRALWRRRKRQYSPPFWCELGPKTPTFQRRQHHIGWYCRTPPKIQWSQRGVCVFLFFCFFYWI